jgi:thiol-disulfide isomerase/thioredoxin
MMPAFRRIATVLVFACGTAATVGTAAPPPSASHPGVPAAEAAPSPGDIVLLDFLATWCGPCRQMAPLIGEIGAAGWTVRHVDVDREHDLVRRFSVTGVPCYILLVKGHEVGRIDGATTRTDLERLLAKARPEAGAARSPEVAAAAPMPGIPLAPPAVAAPLATEPAVQSGIEQRLMQATARLRVDDSSGASWGTGTVIDCRQGEALILTCAHILRDSDGKGRVAVDLFATGAARGIAGQVVAWDLKRDLALVSVFTDTSIEAVRVGGQGHRTAVGDPVVTIGCNGGANPTLHRSRVTAVDKYLGAPNLQVAGQPVQGRSGGGLFAADGTLIGVCNAADPEDNEGLFAALPAIHEQLEEAGLAFVYRNVYPSGGLEGPAGGPGHVPAMPAEMPAVAFDRRDRADAVPTASPATPAALAALAAPPATPETVVPPAPAASPKPAASPAPAAQPLTPGENALLAHVREHQGRAEVICIVRPKGAPDASSEVFVLEGSSRDFVDRLAQAHRDEAIATGPGAAVSR